MIIRVKGFAALRRFDPANSVDDFRLLFAYIGGMRDLTPTQVLAIIAQRMETRAKNLEAVHLNATTATALELRNFAKMVRRALEYVRRQQIRR